MYTVSQILIFFDYAKKKKTFVYLKIPHKFYASKTYVIFILISDILIFFLVLLPPNNLYTDVINLEFLLKTNGVRAN